jgi:hypothetical protein
LLDDKMLHNAKKVLFMSARRTYNTICASEVFVKESKGREGALGAKGGGYAESR